MNLSLNHGFPVAADLQPYPKVVGGPWNPPPLLHSSPSDLSWETLLWLLTRPPLPRKRSGSSWERPLKPPPVWFTNGIGTVYLLGRGQNLEAKRLFLAPPQVFGRDSAVGILKERRDMEAEAWFSWNCRSLVSLDCTILDHGPDFFFWGGGGSPVSEPSSMPRKTLSQITSVSGSCSLVWGGLFVCLGSSLTSPTTCRLK